MGGGARDLPVVSDQAEPAPGPRPSRAAPARPSRPAGRRRSARRVISDGDDAGPGTVSGGSGSPGKEGGLETGPFSSISIVGCVGRPGACTLPTAERKRRMDSLQPVTSVGWSCGKGIRGPEIATLSLAGSGQLATTRRGGDRHNPTRSSGWPAMTDGAFRPFGLAHTLPAS